MAIAIRGMAPLLQVFDMPTSIVFYRDVLGFKVERTSRPMNEHFDWALLTLNGVVLMLNTAYEKGSRPAALDPLDLSPILRQPVKTQNTVNGGFESWDCLDGHSAASLS